MQARFVVTPILSKMQELYALPRTPARFKEYLQHLQGDTKDDMVLPIAGFNPMAKDVAIQKIEELQALGAEDILREVADTLNQQVPNSVDRTFQILLNLGDDVQGAWTNRYTTDYTSKFRLSPMVNRNFCVPYFFTSETFTVEEIRRRALAYAYRTWYWLEQGPPRTLEDLLGQEVYVARSLGPREKPSRVSDFSTIEEFYETAKKEEDYAVLFNFFYGDEASQALGYPTFALSAQAGFAYATHLANQ
ncbi:MAG: hypothetical protein AAFU60_04925 [Bacteroidota bacterium]